MTHLTKLLTAALLNAMLGRGYRHARYSRHYVLQKGMTMKKYLLPLLFIASTTMAEEYGVKAFYSMDFGMSIPKHLEEDAQTSISQVTSDTKLATEAQCLSELNEPSTEKFALAQAENVGAKNVVLKCIKYWSNDNQCKFMIPGCMQSADVNKPKHIQLYSDKLRVPDYLRLKPSSYDVTQIIIYTDEVKTKSGKDTAILVGQQLYNSTQVARAMGKSMSCPEMISSKQFIDTYRKSYFTDKRTKSLKLSCFTIDTGGRTSLTKTQTITR